MPRSKSESRLIGPGLAAPSHWQASPLNFCPCTKVSYALTPCTNVSYALTEACKLYGTHDTGRTFISTMRSLQLGKKHHMSRPPHRPQRDRQQICPVSKKAGKCQHKVTKLTPQPIPTISDCASASTNTFCTLRRSWQK